MRILIPSVLMTIVALSQIASADTFQLSTGGSVEGELLNPDQIPRETYIVKTSIGTQLTLKREQVQKVVSISSALADYERWLPKMPPTVEGNMRMAEICGKTGLPDQKKFHLEQVLKLDPNHATARYSLGYSKIDGRWVKTDEWMKENGFVRFQGAWKSKQQMEIETANAERTLESKLWKKKIKMWRDWLVRGTSKKQDALTGFHAIRDPLALPGLIEFLENDEENENIKILFMEVLEKNESIAAISAIAHRSINDKSSRVRSKALDIIERWKPFQAIPLYVKALQSKNRDHVVRAAEGLSRIGDKTATLPLIDALVTKHKYMLKPAGGNIGANFGQGGGGLNVGGGPKIIEKDLQNPNALDALAKMYPGVNYGYNKLAWKQWYVETTTPENVDLRRG